jgi:sporulation integral membrane protein YtvI
LQRRLKIARGITTIFLIIIVILLVAVAGTAIVNRVIVEVSQLSQALPSQLEDLRNILYDIEDGFERFMTFVPDEFTFDFNELVNQLISFLTSWLGDAAKNFSVGFVTKVPSILLNVLLCLISAFFFTRDKSLIRDTLMKNLPEWVGMKVKMVQEGFLSAISAYLRAQLIIMSVVASLCILGLTILQYPYAVIMGIIICLMDALPLVGSSLIFWPWALMSLLSGNYKYTVGLILINMACFFARQILEPKVLGQQIGVHPLLVLVSIYVGLNLFGVVGLFIGPVMLVTGKLILQPAVKAKV